jgi:hypothetical protein
MKVVQHANSRVDIERFYLQVLGSKLGLSGVPFPEKRGFPAYMAVLPDLDEDIVMTKVCAYFQVKPYIYKKPIAQNIDRKSAQKRPNGLYVLAHGGTDEPDSAHLNKSYDDAMEVGMIFANPLEYPLMTAFHKFKHGKWMDEKEGWTRTSSLWSGGRLVSGSWFPGSQGLYLIDGARDYRNPFFGPRELFLGQ